MAGYHPMYAFEYDINIHEISGGLENFIDQINIKNSYYHKQDPGSEYDIIHFEVSKNPKDNIFMITIKLIYSYTSIGLPLIFELLQDYCDEKYIERRHY